MLDTSLTNHKSKLKHTINYIENREFVRGSSKHKLNAVQKYQPK